MSASPAPGAMPPLGLVLGPIEIGAFLSTLLYGTAVVQTYLYIANYSRDRRWIKAIVGVVCSLETMHTMCIWAYLYHLTVANFGNPGVLNDIPWYFGLTIPLQTFAGSIVQAFFSYRVQVLSGKWWVAAPAYAALLVRCGLGIVVFVFTQDDKKLTVFRDVHGVVGSMSLAFSVVTDMWTTVLLCIYLRNRKSQYVETQNAIHRIILWTLETGLITTLLAVLILGLFLGMPGNGIWVALNLIYPKLYPNSLLVSLNSRGATVRERAAGVLVTRTYDVQGTPGPARMPDEEQGSAVQLDALGSGVKKDYPFDGYQ